MDKLIGRHKEQLILKNCLESGRSEFVVIYGRRRIGKTFLCVVSSTTLTTFRL